MEGEGSKTIGLISRETGKLRNLPPTQMRPVDLSRKGVREMSLLLVGRGLPASNDLSSREKLSA